MSVVLARSARYEQSLAGVLFFYAAGKLLLLFHNELRNSRRKDLK